MSVLKILVACLFPLTLSVNVVFSDDPPDIFEEPTEPLKDFPRQLYVITSKPEDASDLQYSRLITQVELRLRRSGFRIKTGTHDEYVAFRNNVIKNALLSKDYETAFKKDSYHELFLDLNAKQLRTSQYLYFCQVRIETGAWVRAKNGPWVVHEFQKDDGKENPIRVRARLQMVQLYSTSGSYGIVDDWAEVTDVTLHEVDQFINDWLAANPE